MSKRVVVYPIEDWSDSAEDVEKVMASIAQVPKTTMEVMRETGFSAKKALRILNEIKRFRGLTGIGGPGPKLWLS